MKYSKQDQKMMSQLVGGMHIIYKKNKGKMQGGNFGDFILDSLHGMALPITGPLGELIFSTALGPEGAAIVKTTQAVDHALTGQGGKKGSGFFTSDTGRTLLNTFLPIGPGEAIYQIAKANGGKKGRGRPKKTEQPEVKRRVGRPRKN